MNYDICPKCGLDFKGEDIYECMKRLYPGKAEEYAASYGWTPENPKSFRKEIGVEYPNLYDGVAVFECPDCKFKWKRFSWVPDSYLADHLQDE